MTRVFIAGPADNQEETLRLLQDVGVVHVEPAAEMAGEFEKKNADLMVRIKKLDQVIEGVQRFRDRKTAGPHPLTIADEQLVAYADERLSALQEMESRIASLERLKADLSLWGNFDLAHIRAIEEAGVYVRRFRMDLKKWEEFQPPEGLYLETVSTQQAVLFYTVSIGGPPDIPQAQMLSWPESGLVEVEAELRQLAERVGAFTIELAGVAERAEVMKKQLIATLNEAAYTGNMATLYREPYLFGLQGWIPQDQETAFHEKMTASKIPLRVVTREPLDDEEPPVLIRNNWFIQRIEPLLKLYGNPKYRHLDPSYFFAPFMVLFFGICLSDAGYGLTFYLVAYVIGKKWGDKVEGLPLVVKLCKAFAVAAVIVGLMTGSIFGYSFENRSWILMDLDVNVGNPMILFYLSLGLGVIHLTLSYLMGILQAIFFHEKMQKLGLIFVLWGGALLIARNVWFAAPASAMHMPLYYGGVGALAIGLLLTLLFASISRNWAVRLGVGLWNIYGLTGLVGDLLSYARLFGLGIATAAIASVMNQLANMALSGAGPIIGVPLALIIVLLGHTFNLALSLLGSTVHSARLHFVEAFKSFFEGGGVEYKPFKIERGSL
jgi:V/A-type H+-transporting ATPase subunit I